MQQDPQEDDFAPIPNHASIQGSSLQDTPDGGLSATSEPSSASRDTAITGGAPSEFSAYSDEAESSDVEVRISFVSLNYDSSGLLFNPN